MITPILGSLGGTTLKEPEKNGYAALPTFVIDSNKKKVTVIWSELPKDEEGKKGIETAWAIPPPPATDATVVLFTGDQISAIEADLWSITTYSFFPKTGSAGGCSGWFFSLASRRS
jgi:hypothetical protein